MTKPHRTGFSILGRFSSADDMGVILPRGEERTLALGVVIAIMSLFASLTLGTAWFVASAASDWQAQISREATLQLKPINGRDMEQALQNALSVLQSFSSVAQARILDVEETQKLLEPWLGSQAELAHLELPRLIAVRFRDGEVPDIDLIKATVIQDIEGAVFDDHHIWIERLEYMAQMIVLSISTIFILTLVAMILSVVFATRSTLLMNVHIIEVLHFIGADASFVARQFDRQFFKIGFKAGLAGALAALGIFWIVQINSEQVDIVSFALILSDFSLDLGVVGILFALVIFVAGLTMLTCRVTILRQLREIDRHQSDF